MKTVFLRALEELYDKEAALREAIVKPEAARNLRRFDVDPQSFACVVGSPFAYWVSDRLRSLFKELPFFESEGRVARRGVNSNDDQRFLRLAWECSGPEWVLHVKGGVWSPYYADPHMLLKWGQNGAELQAERVNSRVYKFAIVPSRELYFRPGITWPRRTKSNLSFRVMPANCIFGDKGPAAVVEDDDHDQLFCLLAIGNSKVFHSLVEFQLAAADAKAGGAAHSYEVGVIQRTPIPRLSPADKQVIANLARRAWSLSRSLDTRTEASHAFVLPALLQVLGDTLQTRANSWVERVHAVDAEIAKNQAAIEARCFDLYGIDEASRMAIIKGIGDDKQAGELASTGEESDGDVDDEGDSDSEINVANLAAELVSWAAATAFGRFDVRLASQSRAPAPEPAPFDPLPIWSPGMLTDDDGILLNMVPSGYPIAFPENGILVDDLGHSRDLTAGVRKVYDEVFGVHADAFWNDTSAILDPKDQKLRSWISSGLFEHHLKHHSKSRRKAPVIWQLGIPSGRYSVWLYAHRLTRDSFFQVQNDVVALKVAHEERLLTSLVQSGGSNPIAGKRKEIAVHEAYVEELRAMLDEVKRVAPLWNPMLDDGVVLTMAPLWRLVPHHKPWQKELKGKWYELAAGKHDWAHIAMHLWPERVVPKCAADRSLAIAHGIEGIFWIESEDGKWKPRSTPTRSVADLVRERTSIAVKASLKSMHEASAANADGSQGRGRVTGNAVLDGGSG